MSVKCTALIWELENISSEKKLVLLALADNANDNGECWPGLDRIRKKCGYKKIRGLKFVLNKLVKDGLISSEDRHRKDGRQTTNLYTINLEKIDQIINTKTSVGMYHSTGGGCTTVHPQDVPQYTPPLQKNDDFPSKNKYLQKIENRELSRVTNNITKERERGLKKVLCPLNFLPHEKHLIMAKQLGLNIDEEKDSIIDWSQSNGEKKLDWNRAFNNWLRRSSKFNKSRGRANGQSKTSIMFDLCKQSYYDIRKESEDKQRLAELSATAFD